MVGFFDLPWEIRDEIWSESVANLKDSEQPDGDLSITFRRHGQKGVVANTVPWTWLQAVSGVSKNFTSEGRPYFFRTWNFSITEVPNSSAFLQEFSGQFACCFPALQGFLHWAGHDARHIRSIFVSHPRSRHDAGCAAVMKGLNSMETKNLELRRDLSLMVEWNGGHLQEIRGIPELVCAVDEGGRFVAVEWKPKKPEYSRLYSPGPCPIYDIGRPRLL